MANTPKRKKNKVLKIVRKNHIWVTIALCLVIAIVSDVFIALFSGIMGSYVFNSKVGDEYEAVAYMAKLYNFSSDEETDSIFTILNEEGRNYFITDNHGNIIYQYGENTMGTTTGTFSLPITTEGEVEVKAYLDNITEGVFVPNEEGNFEFTATSLLKFAIIPKNIHHYLKQLLKKPLLFQTYVHRFLCTPKTKQDIILSNMQKQNREFG